MFSGLFAKKPQPITKSSEIIQELEQVIIRLQTSINSLKIGFVIVDTTGEIVNINDSARNLFCSEFGKSLSIQAHHLCSLEEMGTKLKLETPLIELVSECLEKRKQILIRDIQFNEQFIYLRIYPILMGGSKDISKNALTGATIIIEDVTLEKIAMQSRDEFLSLASHELRTPLTAIRGNAALIKDYYGEILANNKDLREMMDDIHESSAYLIAIVNEFLDVSRLEQGKMVFNRGLVDLLDVVNGVVNDIKFTAQEKKLSISIENSLEQGVVPFVIADDQRVREVIYNLVGNAVKYTDNGGITVKIQNQGGKIITTVTDTGRGIPKQNQDLLFRKFQQAGRSYYTRDVNRGTGLGLYISRLLAEHMQGQLCLVKSEENTGSSFAFSLPSASDLEIRMLSVPNN